ncbi:Ubiquitin-like-specific protease 2 [Tolypocladium paradoxum]|uniref:Ubiquitin-like-specific protease 2 n=1 Tax=Tolypocladium paradoxum TaxID=94208 RepID=A0A2S4L460_9HYPO|nr:Ubiquitin-like-specific protease 2 [Tolypocladium paradoxum]
MAPKSTNLVDPATSHRRFNRHPPLLNRLRIAGLPLARLEREADPARNRSRHRSDAKPISKPVSNDENHDVVKLDTHAREPQIHESVQAGEREEPKRTRWDADWKQCVGAIQVQSTLVPRLWRGIKALAGPANTLSCPPSSSDVCVLKESPPAKRQRQDGSRNHGPLKSHFFLGSKPAAHEDVLDLTGSISRDDQYDLKSSSSTEKTTPSAAANVSEFRNACPRASSHPSRKKRKSRMPDAVDSPDVLANDEHPPPANIVSDVRQQPPKHTLHFYLSESTGPPIKRPKQTPAPRESIEGSEDELNAEPDKTERKKKNNFSGLGQPRQQIKARGDIHPTVFGSVRRPLETSPPTRPDMALKMAACGKNVYEIDSQGQNQIILRPESNNSYKLVPTTTKGERLQLAWLNINIKTAFQVQHAATASPCVIVSRPKTFNFERKLALEFNNLHGASRLVSMMGGDKAEEKPKAEVEAIVHKAVQDATNYLAANVRARKDTGQQLAMDKHDETPRWATQSTVVVGEKAPRGKALLDEVPRSARTHGRHPADLSGDTEMPLRSHGPDTRRTRRSSPTPIRREPSPDRWTTTHPDWRTRWQRSLVFPATGKNRATVDDEDIPRLDEGEFLNDNLISFYLRYLQAKLEIERPELLNKVYIFSSFFFEKLRSTKGKINYDGVKTWTAKFDLFSYDYIIVPVNEHAHWYLAIICNVPNALNGVPATEDEEVVDVSSEHRDVEMLSSPPSASTRTMPATSPRTRSKTPPAGSGPQKFDPRHPRIVTLDSLDSPHSPTCKALREYLAEEARDKKDVDLALIPNGMTAKRIPYQNNYCDCGVFVLGYTEEFLKDPDEVARKLLHKESPEWDIKPSKLRSKVRSLLFDLQKEQQDRLEKEKEEKAEKRKAAAKKKAAKAEKLQSSQLAESSSTSPKASPEEGASAAQSVKASSASEGVSREQSRENGSTQASPMQKDRSPEGNPQVCDDEELELVSSLNTESSTNTSSPNQVFHSARSSPEGKPPKPGDQAVGKSKNDDEPKAASKVGSVDANELQFVRTLPSSSSDASTDNEAPKTRGQFVKGTGPMPPRGRATAQKSKRSSHFPSSTRHLISVDSPSPKKTRAGYDGIDRTVDLT